MERAPQQGAAWFNGLERAILSLDHHPKRCPVAPESLDPDRPVRVLRYGRKPHAYRVFFTVDDDTRVVRVVHVRGARRWPTPGELFEGDRHRPVGRVLATDPVAVRQNVSHVTLLTPTS